ncbi:DNA gyrase inhibitor YacG [Paracoccus suum]|uniref:DNA gyrase inhibitor YacG n=1 Tax=Paracoccus suum TaxID=2259340 RepID=A0A344PJ95_9RHOB|nr:DNA gyrase inhibitor YacG [Paracoccus suum]AXC49450.1 DNA gyrase inhibitor YacG [Paracoccus suum]
MSAARTAAPQGGNCPICGKATVRAFRPFCSARCADVDLAHWLRGDYRIPAEPVDPEAQDPASE